MAGPPKMGFAFPAAPKPLGNRLAPPKPALVPDTNPKLLGAVALEELAGLRGCAAPKPCNRPDDGEAPEFGPAPKRLEADGLLLRLVGHGSAELLGVPKAVTPNAAVVLGIEVAEVDAPRRSPGEDVPKARPVEVLKADAVEEPNVAGVDAPKAPAKGASLTDLAPKPEFVKPCEDGGL